MRNIWIIFRRELAGYLFSSTAYMAAVAMFVLLGLEFNADLEGRVLGGQPADGTAVLGFFAFLMIFFAPLLTMRLLAEEQRDGTLEVLLSLPVRESEIVLGKFFGAWAYYSGILILTGVYPLILAILTTFRDRPLHSTLDFGPIITAYLGMWLFGGAVLAIGIFFSALTENQVVAGFLSMSVLFILWQGDLASLLPASINSVALALALRQISLQAHYSTSFLLGVVRFEDVIFYCGLITVMLYATILAMESRRWR